MIPGASAGQLSSGWIKDSFEEPTYAKIRLGRALVFCAIVFLVSRAGPAVGRCRNLRLFS